MPASHRILWADDEIDFLKPHIMFLKEKGYEVTPVVSGVDVIEMVKETPDAWDVIMLDENMPGISGIETLEKLRAYNETVPVIMITKSEEEDLMDQAVGNQISDYLIKPVNPNQILLSLKKLLESGRLVTQQATTNYLREFMDITQMISSAQTFEQWAEIYGRLTRRMLEFSVSAPDIGELLRSQHNEAQREFFRFVKKNYLSWFRNPSKAPLLSNNVMEKYLVPAIQGGEKPVLIVMDNFRLDQWFTVKPIFLERFNIVSAELYCAMLPTATQYARNALLSGLLPQEIARLYPELWIEEDDPRSKNLNEAPLLDYMLKAHNLNDCKVSYHKANSSVQLSDTVKALSSDSSDFTVIVVNFIDILSHSKADSPMMRDLVSSDAAFRNLTLSWFRHSPLVEMLDTIIHRGRTLFFTTDHGSILVNKAIKIIGDKETNTALRYKVGKNLSFPSKEVFEISSPTAAGLPAPFISAAYIFAGENDFFAYPNNFSYYSNFFKDTYQHGGVSMEEMIVPIIKMQSKQ